MSSKVTTRVRTALQINMHPFDAPHVVHTLPHQLRAWGGQVERVVITVDTRLASAGRYRAGRYEEARTTLFSALEEIQHDHPNLIIDPVSYDAQTREAIGQAFFSRTPDLPDRAFDGGPFYVYFHGLLRANADYVLHMDSDMLFGGGSQTWIEDAIALFDAEPDALFVGPFPGPPRADGSLDPAVHTGFPGLSGVAAPIRIEGPIPAYRFSTVSTRIFMMDMRRFASRIGSLDLLQPDFKRRMRSLAFGEIPRSMPAEEMLSATLASQGLSRIDYLGQGAGMFSLHPPYRTAEFYRMLPELIARIENGDIPEGQRGDFDMNASMIDWSAALAAKRPSARYRKALSQLMRVQIRRLSGAFATR